MSFSNVKLINIIWGIIKMFHWLGNSDTEILSEFVIIWLNKLYVFLYLILTSSKLKKFLSSSLRATTTYWYLKIMKQDKLWKLNIKRRKGSLFFPFIFCVCLICHRDCECCKAMEIFSLTKQIQKCISLPETCGTLKKKKAPRTLMNADASTVNVGIRCMIFISIWLSDHGVNNS